jgi:hypothetical protein
MFEWLAGRCREWRNRAADGCGWERNDLRERKTNWKARFKRIRERDVEE